MYLPSELCFPSVGIQSHWTTLPVLDWEDIDSHLVERAFLKEIGVQEVPPLDQLISRIIQEHEQQRSKTIQEYKIPSALSFFAEKLRLYYSDSLKTAPMKQAFLPSYYFIESSNRPMKTSESQVILAASDQVYSGFCA